MASHSPSPALDNVHASPEQKHVTPITIFCDFVLCGVFFYFMFGWVKPHVPASSALFLNFFGASTAACVTAVFWMAIQMFRIVHAGEKTLAAERASR